MNSLFDQMLVDHFMPLHLNTLLINRKGINVDGCAGKHRCAYDHDYDCVRDRVLHKVC